MPESSTLKKTAVLGYGKVGRVLTRSLIKSGYNISGVVDPFVLLDKKTITINYISYPLYRNVEELPPGIDLFFITVPDKRISHVVDELVDKSRRFLWYGKNGGEFKPFGQDSFSRNSQIVIHTAGSVSAQLLERVRECCALPLAWHPLQTFTGNEGAEHFKGVTIAIDGDPAAIEVGRQVAMNLGAFPYIIDPSKRATYHLGGVFACNFLSALVSVSTDLLKQSGMTEKSAYQALEPILVSTIKNIVKYRLPDAITGPLTRDDHETVDKHLRALESQPEYREVYEILSKIILKRLGKKGVGGINPD